MLRSRLENLDIAIKTLKAECALDYHKHVIHMDSLHNMYYVNLERLQTLIAERKVVQYMIEEKWMQ